MEKEKTIYERFRETADLLHTGPTFVEEAKTAALLLIAEELNYSNRVLDRIEGRLADISCNLSYRN